ncbi:Pentatricopeptide repeat-containing protein [Durusdinium trenchii]|uniref:Mitochondrial n=1 Tax=Durusdinium trenchii TaxID=1381693 RepID=A0ABP0Q0P8_9DINO
MGAATSITSGGWFFAEAVDVVLVLNDARNIALLEREELSALVHLNPDDSGRFILTRESPASLSLTSTKIVVIEFQGIIQGQQDSARCLGEVILPVHHIARQCAGSLYQVWLPLQPASALLREDDHIDHFEKALLKSARDPRRPMVCLSLYAGSIPQASRNYLFDASEKEKAARVLGLMQSYSQHARMLQALYREVRSSQASAQLDTSGLADSWPSRRPEMGSPVAEFSPEASRDADKADASPTDVRAAVREEIRETQAEADERLRKADKTIQALRGMINDKQVQLSRSSLRGALACRAVVFELPGDEVSAIEAGIAAVVWAGALLEAEWRCCRSSPFCDICESLAKPLGFIYTDAEDVRRGPEIHGRYIFVDAIIVRVTGLTVDFWCGAALCLCLGALGALRQPHLAKHWRATGEESKPSRVWPSRRWQTSRGSTGNVRLYSATCVYLQWADAAEGDVATTIREPSSVALDDPLHRLLKRSKLAESLEGLSWAPEVWVDLLTDCVVISLLIWLVRINDLRSWTHLALVATVLAMLKGLLAWCTVLPDATGWMGCQRRLGPHGLMYFREQNSGALGSVNSILDIFLLTVQSLWLLGRAAPQQLCADTVFCCSTSTTVLVCLGAYDAVAQSVASELRRERRAAILALTGFILWAILMADVTLAVGSKLHYSLDVFMAIPLTFLIYGNPAIAVCASDWAGDAENQRPVSMDGFRLEPDLGNISIEPCCLPFGDLAGQYFLQRQSLQSRFLWTEEQQRALRRKRMEMSGKVEANKRRAQSLAETTASLRASEERCKAQREEELQHRLQEEQELQEKQLFELKERLDETKKAIALLQPE